MLSLPTRLAGLLLIAAALVAAVVDGAKSIAASELVVTPLGQTWFQIDRAGLGAVQQWIQAEVEPWLGGWVWRPAIQSVLALPTALSAAALGALLIVVSTRRRRRPGAPARPIAGRRMS
jgi:hypothetical protein